MTLAALALLLALWAPATVDAASKAEPISTAYCIDCVPFQFKDENGEAAGLIIDLWRLWSEKTSTASTVSYPSRPPPTGCAIT